MRKTPSFITTDADDVRRLIRENPWATIVAHTANGLVASHYPVMLEEGRDDISIVSHVGRPDDELLELGRAEVLVIIQGPHGYISPGWYAPPQLVPTWNHVTAHLYGTPQLLSEEENLRVLGALVDHFEGELPHPVSLETDPESARRIAKGTVGIRIPITRFDARLKLSQNKSAESVARVIDELQAGEYYSNHALAREMRRVHGEHAAP